MAARRKKVTLPKAMLSGGGKKIERPKFETKYNDDGWLLVLCQDGEWKPVIWLPEKQRIPILESLRQPRQKTKDKSAGDHGPQTAAQMAGAELVEPDSLRGNNPNRIKHKRVKNTLKDMMARRVITMRQYQAGTEIEEAHCHCEMLSSGDAIKEQVDTTGRPDTFIARQVEAQSRLAKAMKAVPQNTRSAIEVVCWYNVPLGNVFKGGTYKRVLREFQQTLDLVADEMRY